MYRTMQNEPRVVSVRSTTQNMGRVIVEVYNMKWDEVYVRLKAMTEPGKSYWGIPRGGQYVAAATGQAATDIEDADYIIDDIYDSGATSKKYAHYGKPFLFLIDKRKTDDKEKRWVKFPWEQESVQDFEDDVRRIIQRMDPDSNREGLRETPRRVAEALTELTTPEPFTITTFDSNGYDQMIVESGLSFYTLCEHHMLPFFGSVNIGYIPGDEIIGISKLARIVEYYSKALNTQEYFTRNIAESLNNELAPIGLAVVVKGRHLCQEMRGVKRRGNMITSDVRGLLKTDDKARMEFMRFIDDDCNN